MKIIAYLWLVAASAPALTRAMMLQLSATLRDLGSLPDVHVVTLEGRGKQFCRGRDGKGESRAGMTPYEIRQKMMRAVLDVYQAVADVPVPVVARVQGDALGFGCATAVGCDITLAASNARFAFPEIEHDIPPTMAIYAALGKVQAKALTYLIYSADSISAADSDAFLKKLAGRPRLILGTIKKYQRKCHNLRRTWLRSMRGRCWRW